jgi:hypothetical protein
MNSRSVALSVAIVIAMISSHTIAQTIETEVNRFQPSLASGGDRLGSSVAVDGNLIVVGAPASDVHGHDAGLAFIWEWRNSEWWLLSSIIPPAINPDDFFGASVAVSGEWVAVGAPLNDDMGLDAGAVHIFQVTEGTVSWKQTLYDANSNADNQFGYSVAIDGSTLVAGAPQTDSVNVNEGSATVFRLSGSSTWIQNAYLPSPEGSANEYTGFSVDVSENCTLGATILLGAPETYNMGFVHVYYYDGLNWQAAGSWESPNSGTDYMFGYSVAIDGDLAAIGEPASDELSTNAGAVHVFEYNIGIGFTVRANLEPSLIAHHDFMGVSVSVAGTDVLVGIQNGEGGGVDTGRADLWEVNFSGAYVHSKIYEASDLTGTDVGSLGNSVALSRREAVVGSPQVDSATGAAYIFSNQRYWLTASGGDWIDAPNWTGGRIPDYESAVYFGLNNTIIVDVDNNNAESDSLNCFAGDVTILDASGGGLGSLNIYGETGDALTIASNTSSSVSLALQECTSNVSGSTYVGGAERGEGVFSITSSLGQYADILIGTGGTGDMRILGSSTLYVEGVIQLGTAESSTGTLAVEGSSSLTLTSADGSSYDIDLQDGVLHVESGSTITCDIGAQIHRDGVVQGDGAIAAATIINNGRVISDASTGAGLVLDGNYYQANEDDLGNPVNGLMVIKGLEVSSTGVEISDGTNLDGGCVVGVTDPDLLNLSDVLTILTASAVSNQFSVWFVPVVGDDKYLDTDYLLRGPGSGVSLIVQPLGATFGFNSATAGEGGVGTPKAVVVDDFNGDFIDDVAIAVGGTSNSIDIWLNDGTGLLCLDSQESLASSPGDLVAADFDQDGNLDLATVIPSLDKALVFLNDGSGAFSLGETLTTGNQPEGITAFSLNSDIFPDIAVTNYLDDTLTTYENITTLLPFGFGGGSTVGTVAKPKPVSPGGIGTGSDKDDDLIVGGEDGDVGGHNNDGLLNGIDAVEIYDPLGTPVDLAVLDLNGDGYDDIAVTLDGTDSLSILMNNTTTGFDSAVLNNAGAAGGTLLANDIDDDGDDDLVLIEVDGTSGDSSVVALRNDSTALSRGGGGGNNIAMLAEASLRILGRSGGSDSGLVGAGDIDNDGSTDVVQVMPVASNYQISVQTAVSGSPWAPGVCCLGDIDGSGDVGVDDLLALIGAWGPCSDPSGCLEDIDGSGEVDVDDLLALIGAFGGC